MERDEIEHLIYRILATQDEEIDCEQVFELIARYVDMEVSGKDAARLLPLVHHHLVQCDNCAELHVTLHDLAMLEEQGALPDADDLLDEIYAGTQASAAGQLPGSSAVPHASLSARNAAESPALLRDAAFRVAEDKHLTVAPATRPKTWFNWAWAAAAVAVVAVIAFGVWGWCQSSQLARLTSDLAFIARADNAFSLRGTELDPDARGYLFIDKTTGRGLLTIDRLNALPSDQVYQMWLVTESRTVSAGTFTVSSGKQGHIYFDLDPELAQLASLAITPEPRGGSLAPTSSPVCVWGKQS